VVYQCSYSGIRRLNVILVQVIPSCAAVEVNSDELLTICCLFLSCEYHCTSVSSRHIPSVLWYFWLKLADSSALQNYHEHYRLNVDLETAVQTTG